MYKLINGLPVQVIAKRRVISLCAHARAHIQFNLAHLHARINGGNLTASQRYTYWAYGNSTTIARIAVIWQCGEMSIGSAENGFGTNISVLTTLFLDAPATW